MDQVNPQVTRAGTVQDDPVNAMSVDVEDYFQVSAMEPHFPREGWDRVECRVERNMERVLALFAEHGVKATFFVLGWIAQRYPQLLRQVTDAGHELASHGFEHIRATTQTQEAFREDVVRTKKLLEDTGGVEIKGYRAASYSIVEENLWALGVLAEAEYKYSSSIYPIRHDIYGIPSAPRFAFHPPEAPALLEIPITTVVALGRNWPCGGGGHFRLLPYGYSRWALRRVNRVDGRSAIFYFHPWEVDPAQPKVPGTTLKTRFRHYVNLSRMEGKLHRLCGDFAWDRVDRVFSVA